jgi:hypothetical protein
MSIWTFSFAISIQTQHVCFCFILGARFHQQTVLIGLLLTHILIYRIMYFVACPGPVILIFNKRDLIFILFNYNFRLSTLYTIFIFRGLDFVVSYIRICRLLFPFRLVPFLNFVCHLKKRAVCCRNIVLW